MRTSERGLTIGDFTDRRVIPWGQVDRMALEKNDHFHVVVHAYAGSVIIDQKIESNSVEKTFTNFARSVDQLAKSRQMVSSSAVEGSVNRRIMRAELRRGTGVQLDGADTAATSYWAPDPTGAHDLRLTRMGEWTPTVVTAGAPGSDPLLTGTGQVRMDRPHHPANPNNGERMVCPWQLRVPLGVEEASPGLDADLVFSGVEGQPPDLPDRGQRTAVHGG